MTVTLKVTNARSEREVAAYLYGTSRVVSCETDPDYPNRVIAVVELEGVEPQVQIDRYASGLIGARIVEND